MTASDNADTVTHGLSGDNYDNNVVIDRTTVYVNHHIGNSYHKDDAAVDASPSSFGWRE
jgi:hypothetical protein